MAMLGMTVAQLLLGPADRVWYLYSDDALRVSGRYLLEQHDRVQLVPVPLAPWSLAPPISTGMATANSPGEAIAWQQSQLAERKRRFLMRELTPAERQAAEMVIRTGATDADIAESLHKSRRTVSHQLATVYDKLRLFLGVREEVRVDRHTLISEFAALLPPEGENR